MSLISYFLLLNELFIQFDKLSIILSIFHSLPDFELESLLIPVVNDGVEIILNFICISFESSFILLLVSDYPFLFLVLKFLIFFLKHLLFARFELVSFFLPEIELPFDILFLFFDLRFSWFFSIFCFLQYLILPGLSHFLN